MNRAKLGDHVRVQYVGLCQDRTRPRQQTPRRVLEFIVGSREAIPGVSFGVVGMAEGEQKRLTLQPKDAYGTRVRKLIKEVPRDRVPEHIDLRLGMRLTTIGVSSRRRRRVKLVEIKPDAIVVDGNHPLAGKVLEVELQLLTLEARHSSRF
jgi:peptidylprolyl isomerase